MDRVFVPGWGAPASLYAPLLPDGWTAVDPPSFAAARGVIDAYVLWLLRDLAARGRAVVGGHSMGGALALLAAARAPELCERLVLISPAGLPIVKPMRASLVDFARQVRSGVYAARPAMRAAGEFASAPGAALRLARHLRRLDLLRECARVRRHGIDVLVVGCATDTLVRCESTRRLAAAAGGTYIELRRQGGHMWMLEDPLLLAEVLVG